MTTPSPGSPWPTQNFEQCGVIESVLALMPVTFVTGGARRKAPRWGR